MEIRSGLPKYSGAFQPNALCGRIGNINGFLFNGKGMPRLCLGPDWLYFLGLLIAMIVLIWVFIIIIAPSNYIAYAGELIFAYLIICFLLASFLNPGILFNPLEDESVDSEPSNKSRRFCKICGLFRAERTEHCDQCGVCIDEYDHHCPWISKCIGRGNIIFFYGFLAGLVITVIYMALTIAFLSNGTAKQ
ncbi:unnamed protein product [Blepharisma stoltei]|uniref:Palmitoyltransferase n=1 Tax=Blepharisma stoltei TaxID=1481888 RepID=A0AAU9IG43_9CILI|nr:unnamed protein product [Blepharisma stoltei]